MLVIHGFLHEKQKAIPEWGSIKVVETVLIETLTPESDIVTILENLPAAPNNVTAENPLGISFTFDVSLHPKTDSLVLRSAGELRQVPNTGNFWEIELTYGIHSFLEMNGIQFSGTNNNPRLRKDQREHINPMARPVVWNSSTQLVRKETYVTALVGQAIVHTNLLPIADPVTYEEVHESHNFSYNIDESVFSYDNFNEQVGKVNDDVVLGRPAGTIKFAAFNVSEEFESVSTGGVDKTEFNYYRVTLTFEYNPSGWDNDAKIVSMSTVQLINGVYERIPISNTEYATEPWPLDANGLAIPFNNNDPTNYGYVTHGYPKATDLSTVCDSNALQGKKSLAIP